MLLTIQQIIDTATEQLHESGSARLDAELLLAHLLDKDRTWLHTWSDRSLDDDQQNAFQHLLSRRIKGEPIAYIIGEQEFWSLTLKVTPATLIPRPETEHLVETALEKIPADTKCQILDLGTGSGAIALAIARERPNCSLVAVDRSLAALQVAQHNARLNHVTNITFIESDWFDAITAMEFDYIVANPPYVCDQDPHLHQGDVRFEPISALASGSDGLDDIRQISSQAPTFLRPGGWLIMEHGFDQADVVAAILHKNNFYSIYNIKDYADQPRITLAQR